MCLMFNYNWIRYSLFENEFYVSIPDEVLLGENLDTYTDMLNMVAKLCERQ